MTHVTFTAAPESDPEPYTKPKPSWICFNFINKYLYAGSIIMSSSSSKPSSETH
jgi:hypothetical protein